MLFRSNTELRWFKSYLENRKHRTFANGTLSDLAVCNFGVPQGSNLAPILFLVFINDIYYLPLLSQIFSYDDDSTVLITAPTVQGQRLQLMMI